MHLADFIRVNLQIISLLLAGGFSAMYPISRILLVTTGEIIIGKKLSFLFVNIFYSKRRVY